MLAVWWTVWVAGAAAGTGTAWRAMGAAWAAAGMAVSVFCGDSCVQQAMLIPLYPSHPHVHICIHVCVIASHITLHYPGLSASILATSFLTSPHAPVVSVARSSSRPRASAEPSRPRPRRSSSAWTLAMGCCSCRPTQAPPHLTSVPRRRDLARWRDEGGGARDPRGHRHGRPLGGGRAGHAQRTVRRTREVDDARVSDTHALLAELVAIKAKQADQEWATQEAQAQAACTVAQATQVA